MWKHPWGYAEGLAICCGLFVTGVLLQISVGKIEASWLTFPFGLIAGVLFLILLIVLHAFSGIPWWCGGLPGIRRR